jgi:diphthamide biosynthesis protein 7
LIVSQSDGSVAWLPSVAAAVRADEATFKTAMETRFSRERGDEEEEEQEDDEDDDEEASSRRPSDWPEKPIGLETWHAHDHEAWIAAFDAHSDGRTIWSGKSERTLVGNAASQLV